MGTDVEVGYAVLGFRESALSVNVSEDKSCRPVMGLCQSKLNLECLKGLPKLFVIIVIFFMTNGINQVTFIHIESNQT